MNNNPDIIIIRGAICLSSIGLTFISYSWSNRVLFGILLFTLFVGKIQQFLPNLVAPHRAHGGLVHLHFIREVYLD